ncbi:hypothetical protein [Caulobacter sp. LjRoot300]|uniref:hypothetical protein n=1 Tax=Caulobacter sp. LjRoot300 TaxID=3342321 RepID=UPI003ECD8BD2
MRLLPTHYEDFSAGRRDGTQSGLTPSTFSGEDHIAEEGAASGGEPITLTIRCQSNKTELYVNWNDYLGDDSHDVYNDWKQVIVRVGTAEATTQRWGISTDSNATFAPGSPVALIQKMGKADRLVLQTTPYNENPVTAVFKLNGMDIATKQLGESCSWKP